MKKGITYKVITSTAVSLLVFSMVGAPMTEAKSNSYRSSSSYKSSSSKSSYSSKNSYKSKGSYKPSKNNSSNSGSSSNKSSSNSNSTAPGSVTDNKGTTTNNSSGSSVHTQKENTPTTNNQTQVSPSNFKYKSSYSGSSYQPSGNDNFSKYQGKTYYKSGSGFATTLLTAAGVYYVLDSFSSDSEPVYVNAETGEELDIDEIEGMDVVPVAVDGTTTEPQSYTESLVTEESNENEVTTPVVDNESSPTNEEVRGNQREDQGEEEQEQEKSGIGVIEGLIGGLAIGATAAFITRILRRK